MDSFRGSSGLFNALKKDAKKGEEPEDKVKIWVLRCGRTGRVHYLEAYKDFVDLLLDLLMLRTGALIRLNRAVSPAMNHLRTGGGIYGVYDSFKSLEDSLVIVDRDILLDPFQAVKVTDELHSLDSSDFECCNVNCSKFLCGSRQICRNCTAATHFSCILCGGYFRENAHTSLCYTPWRPWRNHMTAAPILTRYTVVQSSSPKAGGKKPKKEGYVKMNIPYIITNELNVTPLSTFKVSEVLKNCGAGNCDNLECYELSIGTTEILVMIGAALTSTTPLTDIFGNMCKKRTKLPSSASFCLLPSFRKKSERKAQSPDNGGSSPSRQGRTDQKDKQGKKNEKDKQCKKNEKDLPDQALNKLPPRLQVEEQTNVCKPPEYVLRRSELPSKPPEYLLRGSELTRRQSNEQIPRRISFQEQSTADMAQEPQPNCLGVCSSKGKESPGQTPQSLPFQQLPAAIEDSETQPTSSPPRRRYLHEQTPTQSSSFRLQPAATEGPETQQSCLGRSSSSRRQLPEQTPTQLSSFELQPAYDQAPEPRVPICNESSLFAVLNSEFPPQQSILIERRFRDSAICTTASPCGHQTRSPAETLSVPLGDAVHKAVLTRTPRSTTLIRQSAEFSSAQSLPTLPVPQKSQSILNPLFRERPPSSASSRSSQPPTSTTASIVHRSYPQSEPQPRVRGFRPALFFGKHFAGAGFGSLSSVAAAFEQGVSGCPACSDGESNYTTDGSDGCTLN